MKIRGVGLAFLVMLGWSVIATARSEDICSEPVPTASGLVQGHDDPQTATCFWKGVPYAAAPVGELRFKAPQPKPAWSGVLDAATYGDQCMQVLAGDKARKHMSEDCLYLNVWRPKQSGSFPVMVWIHGGGYIMGSGGRGGTGFSFDGGRLAEFGDVVVVTTNYRLHAFGFLADPGLRAEDPNGSTGSYGSLDQAAAIKWVHDNIAGFGGDPGNLTIFGESAGGWSICTMLATPLNQGMIQRAILESGGCEKSESLEQGYEKAKMVWERIGCDPGDLACLRAAPAEKFLGGLKDLYREGMPYAPHEDGYLLTGTPLSMIRAGHYNRVPFVAGSNRNEVDAVLFFRRKLWRARPAQYENRLQSFLGLDQAGAAQVARLYPLGEFGPKPRQAFGRAFTDAGLACPTYLGLAAAAELEDAAYLYRFDYDEMKYGGHIGALHGMEVPLVFGTLKKPFYHEKNLGGAKELSRMMQGYWTNFAKTGDPNGAGLVEWPRFTSENQLRLILDTEVKAEPADMKDRCAFWDTYYDDHPGFEGTLGKKQGGK
jgi:para-nitrobenzyl esterase